MSRLPYNSPSPTRYRFLLPLVLLFGCGETATTPNASLLLVTVINTSTRTDPTGDYTRSITFRVSDRSTLQPVPGSRIILQAAAGNLAPLPLFADQAGVAQVFWEIPPALQTPGSVYSLAFCAPNPGKGSCRTNLNDPGTVQAYF